MTDTRVEWEIQLNDLRAERRAEALDALLGLVAAGEIALPEPGNQVNLHCHTSFSFNGYGYSPSCFAWKARCAGLRVAGIVDFDVLDGVEEFLGACAAVGLRGCAGIETRVFIREFETREINSPGEPGISYHMGTGLVSSRVPDDRVLRQLRSIAQERNRCVASRVNAFLGPGAVDYEQDVLPLTPNGNATERHLCAAYDRKAQAAFRDPAPRTEFWAAKLGTPAAEVARILDDAPALQGLIRSKLIKAGGPGYVKPSGPDFPPLEAVNELALSAGAIPTFAWLDGTTAGEQAIEELLDLMLERGAAAVNIIPDRNWNIKDPVVKKKKLDLLYQFVDLTLSHDLPIVAGTEMNAYGQRFVDDFEAPEMKPLTPVFLEGAHILYAHTRLQAHAGMGYLSDWARRSFTSAREKNAFFARVGETLDPSDTDALRNLTPALSPSEIEAAVSRHS